MSFSFIIIDISNQINLLDCEKFIKEKYFANEYEIVYCASKETNAGKNTNFYLFEPNENTEAIINIVIKKCKYENIVVVRDSTEYKSVDKLTEQLKTHSDIVYFKKKQNKVQTFFSKFFNKIISWLYLYKLIPAKFSAVAFGEDASIVLKNIDAPSVCTKINKWSGLNLIGIDGGKQYKFNHHILKSILKMIVPFVIGIGILLLLFFVKGLVKKYVLATLLIFVLVLCIILGAVYSLNMFIKLQVGDNVMHTAKILNNKGEKKDEKN